MATRAQRFKYQEEIKQGADKPKAAPTQHRRKRDAVEAESNRNADHGDHATYEYETTAAGTRPSRKSTRRAANRIKPDSQLRRRQTRRTRS